MLNSCYFSGVPKSVKMAHRNRPNSRTRALEVVAVKSESSSQNTKEKENNSGILESASNEISLSIQNREFKESTIDENQLLLEEQAPLETEDSIDQLLDLNEAEALAKLKGCKLPQDFIKAADSSGIRASTLKEFLTLQSLMGIGFLVHTLPWVRDRLIADPSYLFKVFTEVIIDSGCATLAEVGKRGSEFFAEFEFYLSDMIVGLVLDVALVSLLAPVAIIGARPASATKRGFQKYIARLPSAIFEANVKGIREYTLTQRIVSFFYKGLQYSIVGFACGLGGQALANSFMLLRRHLSDGGLVDSVEVPPLFKTALVWALFMGVSSNTRYQIVVGLERLVDMSIAKRVPQIAYFTTIGIRFINNVIGGENFIDMARWAGVQ